MSSAGVSCSTHQVGFFRTNIFGSFCFLTIKFGYLKLECGVHLKKLRVHIQNRLDRKHQLSQMMRRVYRLHAASVKALVFCARRKRSPSRSLGVCSSCSGFNKWVICIFCSCSSTRHARHFTLISMDGIEQSQSGIRLLRWLAQPKVSHSSMQSIAVLAFYVKPKRFRCLFLGKRKIYWRWFGSYVVEVDFSSIVMQVSRGSKCISSG